MRYRVSADAERDLEEIFLYWASRASVVTADRVVDGLRIDSGCLANIRTRASLQVTLLLV